jgi:hypothetical protein
MWVFENRILMGIFGPKREEIARSCRRLHDEELHNIYVSPYIIMVIKSRRMRWTGHAARMDEMRNTVFWLENLKGSDHSEDTSVHGRIILEWILWQ